MSSQIRSFVPRSTGPVNPRNRGWMIKNRGDIRIENKLASVPNAEPQAPPANLPGAVVRRGNTNWRNPAKGTANLRRPVPGKLNMGIYPPARANATAARAAASAARANAAVARAAATAARANANAANANANAVNANTATRNAAPAASATPARNGFFTRMGRRMRNICFGATCGRASNVNNNATRRNGRASRKSRKSRSRR